MGANLFRTVSLEDMSANQTKLSSAGLHVKPSSYLEVKNAPWVPRGGFLALPGPL